MSIFTQYEMSQRDFFGNCKQGVVLRNMASMKRMHSRVDKEEFVWAEFPPIGATAHFFPPTNSIGKGDDAKNNFVTTFSLLVISGGLLQVPWFDSEWPE